jgi:hypothetical protein
MYEIKIKKMKYSSKSKNSIIWIAENQKKVRNLQEYSTIEETPFYIDDYVNMVTYNKKLLYFPKNKNNYNFITTKKENIKSNKDLFELIYNHKENGVSYFEIGEDIYNIYFDNNVNIKEKMENILINEEEAKIIPQYDNTLTFNHKNHHNFFEFKENKKIKILKGCMKILTDKVNNKIKENENIKSFETTKDWIDYLKEIFEKKKNNPIITMKSGVTKIFHTKDINAEAR